MEQLYKEKLIKLGYNQLVCDIFPKWEDVKDEILVPERKSGTGNGTIHVFLGAADNELQKEFSAYYHAVNNGEDPSIGAIEVKHYFLASNVLSMLGYVCQYYYSKGQSSNEQVRAILSLLSFYHTENGLLETSSFFKLSTGASKLRPYFKQFDSNGVFTKLIRQLLLPNSGYKISLYKNSEGRYAAFWLIGFEWQTDFEAYPKKSLLFDKKSDENKRNPLQQIYYGAPGTGKSHGIKEQTEGKQVIRTTFHPDSDYSTFVGAYKPTTVDEPLMTVIGTKAVPVENADGTPRTESKIVYEFVEQAFLQAYIKAWKQYTKATAEGKDAEEVYLVIEEINRGNCAQIFGDLFQLLDRGENGFSEYPINADNDLQKHLDKAFEGLYFDVPAIAGMSAEKVGAKLRSGEVLLLPSNLYIWATMNTSDQSLFPIDSAFKRRWDWVYMPISDAKKNYVIEIDNDQYDWWSFLTAINAIIESTTHSEDKKLGYFFAKAKDNKITADVFVGKIIFYLWNDVFKDNETNHKAFKDENGEMLAFHRFFHEDGSVNTNVVIKFLQDLEVYPFEIPDDGTSVPSTTVPTPAGLDKQA